MPTYKLDTAPQKTPRQLIEDSKNKDMANHMAWIAERTKQGDTYTSKYLQLLKKDAIRYKRGSLMMAGTAVALLINRLVLFNAWFFSDWEKMLRPVPIAFVVLTLLFGFLDLKPYLFKSRMRYARGYAIFCKELYWLSILAVILSYAKGSAAEVIYAGIMVVLCGFLWWVNVGKRQYRPSDFASGFLTVVRWVILIAQCLTVFFPKQLAQIILGILGLFLE